MRNVWFVSDTHFGHVNCLKWHLPDGQPMRPFATVDEMDEELIHRWNDAIKPNDLVYHLGDFSWAGAERTAEIARVLHGTKRLILGNHDEVKGQRLLEHFQKVGVWRIFDDFGFICTHVPITQASFRKMYVNVHGHIHGNAAEDEQHECICVEHTGFKPLHLDELLTRLHPRLIGYKSPKRIEADRVAEAGHFRSEALAAELAGKADVASMQDDL